MTMAKVSNRIRALSRAAIIGLFLMTPCVAEPLPLEISSASAGHDPRISKPVLKLSLTGVSKQAIYYLSINNIGEKFDLRIRWKDRSFLLHSRASRRIDSSYWFRSDEGKNRRTHC